MVHEQLGDRRAPETAGEVTCTFRRRGSLKESADFSAARGRQASFGEVHELAAVSWKVTGAEPHTHCERGLGRVGVRRGEC